MDVLQCLGVAPEIAANYAASIVRNKPRFRQLASQLMTAQKVIASISGRSPTFMEIYGRGRILEAAHGCRRNLNITGLDALDLRTSKPDGSPWNFDLPGDRREARRLVETQKPTWLVGYPPCTAFTRLNVQWNYHKMDPRRVEQMIDEGRRHLHFMISLYRIQLNAGRHF